MPFLSVTRSILIQIQFFELYTRHTKSNKRLRETFEVSNVLGI